MDNQLTLKKVLESLQNTQIPNDSSVLKELKSLEFALQNYHSEVMKLQDLLLAKSRITSTHPNLRLVTSEKQTSPIM